MEDQIMESILARIVQTGTTPSVREIAKEFGYPSENSVRHYLKKLRESGHLTKANKIELADRYRVKVELAG